MKNSNARISEIFGDDVQHLHGNLFRARRGLVKLANSGLSVQEGKLVYGNPRWFVNKSGEPEAKGIEKGKMEELRNSIQDEGLENPIRLRVKEGKKNFLEVINGERRLRCVEQLCERDVPCFDAESNSQRPASEMYEWIECRIEFMDDEMALRCALKPNETSEVIGELASLNVVKTLRDSGFDDQDILKATGKSISWLRETEKIIGLDEVCLGYFENEKINRKVALHLAQIEDAEERIATLEKINEAAMARHSEKIKQAEKKVSNANKDQECQETAAHLAKKSGDDEAAEQHIEKSKKAKKRAEEGSNERRKLSGKSATATSKDLESVSDVSKPLSHNKIQSLYMDLIEQIIESEGIDESGDSMGINLELLKAVAGVLSAIMSGKKEAIDVIAEHCPLVMDEDELAEISDEDDQDEVEEDEDEVVDEEEAEVVDEIDEDDTPIELEKEFEEAAVNDDEDFE